MLVLDLLNGDPRNRSGGAAPRHPEKAHRPDQPVLKKPDWIRVKAPGSAGFAETHGIVKEHGLVTVCEEVASSLTLVLQCVSRGSQALRNLVTLPGNE